MRTLQAEPARYSRAPTADPMLAAMATLKRIGDFVPINDDGAPGLALGLSVIVALYSCQWTVHP